MSGLPTAMTRKTFKMYPETMVVLEIMAEDRAARKNVNKSVSRTMDLLFWSHPDFIEIAEKCKIPEPKRRSQGNPEITRKAKVDKEL